MIVLPAEVFLMLILVMVLPFMPRNHFARRFPLVHVFLVGTTLGGLKGGRGGGSSELATQRDCEPSPHVGEP